MQIRTISFTEKGFSVANRLSEHFQNEDYQAFSSSELNKAGYENVSEWTKASFETCDLLIFVGALGICVRMISALLKDKYRDPAVLCIDENQRFVISVSSGHMGGANEFACAIADVLGAQPVITTATDINHRFAVDLFAKKKDLYITDRTMAKKISSLILKGEKIGFIPGADAAVEVYFSDRKIPEELSWNQYQKHNIVILDCPQDRVDFEHSHMESEAQNLYLLKKNYVVGIGCRKDASYEHVKESINVCLNNLGIIPEQLLCLASIDVKKNEPAIIAIAKEMAIPFYTYSAEDLLQIPGEFTESEFVKKTVGVGNVCERSAIAAVFDKKPQNHYEMILKKYIGCDTTISVVAIK